MTGAVAPTVAGTAGIVSSVNLSKSPTVTIHVSSGWNPPGASPLPPWLSGPTRRCRLIFAGASKRIRRSTSAQAAACQEPIPLALARRDDFDFDQFAPDLFVPGCKDMTVLQLRISILLGLFAVKQKT